MTANADASALKAHLLAPEQEAERGGPYTEAPGDEGSLIPPDQRPLAPFAHVLGPWGGPRLDSVARMCCAEEFLCRLVAAYRAVHDVLASPVPLARRDVAGRLARHQRLVGPLASYWRKVKQAGDNYDYIVLHPVKLTLDLILRRWWLLCRPRADAVQCLDGFRRVVHCAGGRWDLAPSRCLSEHAPSCKVLEVLDGLALRGRGGPALRGKIQKLRANWHCPERRRELCIELSALLLAATAGNDAQLYTDRPQELAGPVAALGGNRKKVVRSRRYPRDPKAQGDAVRVRFWTAFEGQVWAGDGRLDRLSLSGARLVLDKPLPLRGSSRRKRFAKGAIVRLVCWELDPQMALRAEVVRTRTERQGRGGKRIQTCGLRFTDLTDEVRRWLRNTPRFRLPL
ncbi:MAG: PilZ domain-containing protein [Candidatus Brocadiia bacterium]